MNRYAYVGGNPVGYVDPLGLDELNFNGSELTWLDDYANILEQWPAVSGSAKGCQCSAEQDRPNFGPIPDGLYELDPKNINRKTWYKRRWGRSSDWGKVRTHITPLPGTNTFGRDQMYMHGGTVPGSAGCIDLTKSNELFHRKLKRYNKKIKLTVKNLR